ncbi:MAG: sugar transferase, partial [Actinomycetota bacterium]|nr:sugar transferase [Actinomycetota bacterium]
LRAFEAPEATGGPGPLVAVADEEQSTRVRNHYVQWVKPVLDRAAALLLAIAFLPVVLGAVVVVLVCLGRPVFYRQRRVGRNGSVFRVWKLRTMLPDRRVGHVAVEVDRRICHKRKDDPRHTAVGAFLRKWSLDELPQLANILAGHMSLVGPRPELVEVVERYEPWQHRRHELKPGLTGLWQISRRGDGLMHEHTEIDLRYVDSVGPRTDLRILVQTVPAALGRYGTHGR